ncbi:hypothetical protein KGF86_08685 [Ornithinibacillus massiliensis]|uniref:Uncharacterized protein n=1 Tax=Ornithinibacillus massiliensis TaxID=1944633 RepID=A0ABS5MD94_9BACI|nr:hypothetical protein [Ornithinibacillus massiliensis]MBS3680291.1 hypothetical protein [Ornithinibacillus massiliensis]
MKHKFGEPLSLLRMFGSPVHTPLEFSKDNIANAKAFVRSFSIIPPFLVKTGH